MTRRKKLPHAHTKGLWRDKKGLFHGQYRATIPHECRTRRAKATAGRRASTPCPDQCSLRGTYERRTIRVNLKTSDVHEARAKLERLKADGKKEPQTDTPPDVVTYERLERLYLDDCGAHNKSTPNVKHVRAFFRGMRADEITTGVVKAFETMRRRNGAAEASINNDKAALNRMFSLAVEHELIDRRPVIKKRKVRNARQGFFTDAGVFAVLKYVRDATLRAVIMFGYITAWRRGEILRLTWSQVDFAAGVVRIDETKNDESREFPFDAHPALRALLDGQRARVTDLERRLQRIVPWVFPRPGGDRVRDFRAAWDRAIVAAAADHPQLRGKLFHDLRRSGVRNLVRAGVSEKVAMEITGHKSRSVFDRYNVSDDRDRRAAVERLAAAHPLKTARLIAG